MHLAVVACGDRLEETLTMVKSAVLLSDGGLRLHVFAEEQLHPGFRDTLPQRPRRRVEESSSSPAPPRDSSCPGCGRCWGASTRRSWPHAAPEHEEPARRLVHRFARHPYYGATASNSGVMLMNLTRIRSAYFKNDMTSVGLRWEELLMPLLQKYKLNITWGDQDLLNIIFHHNPGLNYFGVLTLGQQKYPFGADPVAALLAPLDAALRNAGHTYCGKARAALTGALARSLDRVRADVPPSPTPTPPPPPTPPTPPPPPPPTPHTPPPPPTPRAT
ncbi:hypothetical protein CRUP_010757 [Coryphaenoides rupestris]|nr:hypothetical protein CRUP_010757 [Coryphaenoides rupestris]